MDKLNISTKQLKNAEEAVKTLFTGSQLSHFQVYSIVINLCFRKLPKLIGHPVESWLNSTGRIAFVSKLESISNDIVADKDYDFFDSRERVLEEVYRLIGKEVLEIDIDPTGILELRFETGNLIIAGDETDLEEIWSVTSDTPEPYGDQDWAITLTDQGELVTRQPQNDPEE